MEFQIQLAAKEATDLDFVPPGFSRSAITEIVTTRTCARKHVVGLDQ